MTKDGRFVAWSVATVVLVAQLVAPPVAEAAPAATDGALTSGDWLIPNQGNGGYDVEHYDVDLEFFPDPHAAPGTVVEDCSDESGNGPGSIKATTTVHATTTSLLRSFGLDFKGLTVTRVTVDGVAAQFSRVQDAAADKFKLVVTPAAPVTGDFEVAVAYEGVPETYQFDAGFDMGQGWMKTWDYCGEGGDHFSDGGATGIGQPAGGFTWFPNNTTPTDKATYTIRLTGPSEYTGLSVGVLTDESALAGGRTSWTWDVTVPTTTFLVFVSFGAYDVRTSTVELLDGSTIPQWSVGHDFMKEDVAYDIDDLDGLVGEVIRWHEARFGHYQPTSAGYLLAPLMSGWALETVGRPVFTWAMNEIVVVHEYAHQWAGDSVSVTDWSDLWLAEGFATYAEWLWEGDHGGAGPLEVGRSLLTSSPLHAHWKQRVAAPTRAELWGWGSYDGGGLALAALQAGVGDDAFFRIMRTWFDRYANSNASTWDFIALAEEVSGRELTA
ncbi:MAG: hypothetical protein LBS56_00460, partial [Propionibacteriaceae bacterium]|nr:hypothetical protein [Propionibacteriaceae bacterium]